MDEQDDLFSVARRQREMEIARYKADPSIPAPVMISARNNSDVRIKWETKHIPDPKEPTPVDNYSHLTTEQLNQLIHDLSRDSRLKYDTRPEMMVWDEGDYVEIDEATGEVTVGPGLRFDTKAPESL